MPVKVFATFVTGKFAPASVVAPVPPLAIGSVCNQAGAEAPLLFNIYPDVPAAVTA